MRTISLRLVIILLSSLLIVSSAPADTPKHPDDVECENSGSIPGWNMDTTMDFSGEDGRFAYVYWLYKLFSPRLATDCRVEEFFKGQDLDFGKELNATAETTATLTAVGDLMVRQNFDSTTAAHLYDDIESELFGSDILFGNFETPSNPALPSKRFPAYNLDTQAARIYLGVDRKKGFNIVSTANNHVLDQGEEGLLATLDQLDKLGVAHVGSSRSVEERDTKFPIIDANGIKIAFLAYTFSTNGKPIPKGREYEVNWIQMNTMKGEPDISLIEKHINTARERGADVVAVSLHWGVESEIYPPVRIINLGHRIADAGADIILGHHPHIINPMERYIPEGREGSVPEVLIIYSMGNFIPDAYSMQNQTGLIVHVTFARGQVDGLDRVWIKAVDRTPVWWFCRTRKSKRDFRLLNICRTMAHFGDNSKYPFMRGRDWREIRRAYDLVNNFVKSCE